MAIELETKAPEKGTYVITATYTDEDGNAVTPNAVTWTLTDKNGVVVNSREDVAISVPGTSNDIVLSGDDLAVDNQGLKRRFLIEGTYDSSLGSDLPLNEEAVFTIDDFVALDS